MFLRRLRRGASAVEYAILISFSIAALLGMSVYVKRALSGRWRSAYDATFGHGRQFQQGVSYIPKD